MISYTFLLGCGVTAYAALTSSVALVEYLTKPDECELTTQQEALFQGLAAQINATCSYNITVGPTGVMTNRK